MERLSEHHGLENLIDFQLARRIGSVGKTPIDKPRRLPAREATFRGGGDLMMSEAKWNQSKSLDRNDNFGREFSFHLSEASDELQRREYQNNKGNSKTFPVDFM